MPNILAGRPTRLFRILLAAILFTAFTVASAFLATTANAASTCQTYNPDGFSIGVCLNQLQTTDEARSEIYINSYNSNVLNGCYIDLELWDENGGGKVIDTIRDCTTHWQYGQTYANGCATRTMHADAYLHAANGGFRVGPSTSVTIYPQSRVLIGPNPEWDSRPVAPLRPQLGPGRFARVPVMEVELLSHPLPGVRAKLTGPARISASPASDPLPVP